MRAPMIPAIKTQGRISHTMSGSIPRFFATLAARRAPRIAPVMMISEQTYGKLTGNEAVRIIKNIRLAENN